MKRETGDSTIPSDVESDHVAFNVDNRSAALMGLEDSVVLYDILKSGGSSTDVAVYFHLRAVEQGIGQVHHLSRDLYRALVT